MNWKLAIVFCAVFIGNSPAASSPLGQAEESEESSEEVNQPSVILPHKSDLKQFSEFFHKLKESINAEFNPAGGKTMEDYLVIARGILDRVPLVDGHNDYPNNARQYASNQLANFNLTDLVGVEPWASATDSHTDINRLREGRVGAQFWVSYAGCSTQHFDAVQKFIEQIDIIHRTIEAYPDVFQFASSAQGIEDAFAQGKIASLIGVEGGHAIGSSLAILRSLYRLGARYMTLTHGCPTPWADNSQLDNPGQTPIHNGLTEFGKTVVKEMNRLGMMVDISHVSLATMWDVLNVSQAPVIFSHSGAFSVCNNTRNVRDEILEVLPKNGGIVMVVFYNEFLRSDGQNATIQDVIDHLNHIRKIAGVDHVGIGSDYDGVKKVPIGLEDVSKYPYLFAELLKQGWTEADLEKLAGKNLLRVFRDIEKVRDDLAAAGVPPYEDLIPAEDISNFTTCRTPN